MKVQWRSLSYKSRCMSFCSVASFINAADRVLMPLTIVSMTTEYNWSLIRQGWILSTFAIGYFVSQIVGLNFLDKYGSRNILSVAVFLWSLSTIITPLFASNYFSLLALRIILGFGEGLGLPAIVQIFSQHIPLEHRNNAYSYMFNAASAGQVFASLIVPHIDWRQSFLLFGTIGFVWLVFWLLNSHSTPPTVSEEDGLIQKEIEDIKVTNSEWFCHWGLWAIYIAHFAMNWSNYIVMQWLPTYFVGHLGAKKESLSLTAVPYIVNSFSGSFWSQVADTLLENSWSVIKVRKIMTLIGLFIPGLCLILIIGTSNIFIAVCLTSIAMGFCASNSVGHLSNHADVAPNHAVKTFAVSNTLATIPGILCGPITAELVTASHGRWFPVFILAGFINFTASIIYYSQSSAIKIL